MNYCTVQEAWGKENYISNQYKNFNHNKKPIEKFSNYKKNNNQTKINKIENFTSDRRTMDRRPVDRRSSCDDFVTHLRMCKSCQSRTREEFKPQLLENFEDIIQTNRDIIVLILVGMCILIFFNLISNSS